MLAGFKRGSRTQVAVYETFTVNIDTSEDLLWVIAGEKCLNPGENAVPLPALNDGTLGDCSELDTNPNPNSPLQVRVSGYN